MNRRLRINGHSHLLPYPEEIPQYLKDKGIFWVDSDKKFMQDNLYYADPLFIFDFCKRNFAKNISLIHDYDLYEFTILVTKD